MDTNKNTPVSILSVYPIDLNIKALVRPDVNIIYGTIPYSLSVGNSEYNEENKTITLRIKFEIEEGAKENKDLPFLIFIQLDATFKVDDNRFPDDYVIDWVTKNAPLIVFPYIREYVASLTIRAGFKPFMLPFVEVSAFSIKQPNNDKH